MKKMYSVRNGDRETRRDIKIWVCIENDIVRTIPDRLYELTSVRIPNSLITMEQSEGVGEKREQLITKISIDFGSVPVLLKALRTQSYITVSLSFLAAAAERSALLSTI